MSNDIADRLLRDAQRMSKVDPVRGQMAIDFESVVTGWAEQIMALRLEVKGLWLVDFGNGDGSYCWRYPENSILHYRGYDGGFGGRVKIA